MARYNAVSRFTRSRSHEFLVTSIRFWLKHHNCLKIWVKLTQMADLIIKLLNKLEM